MTNNENVSRAIKLLEETIATLKNEQKPSTNDSTSLYGENELCFFCRKQVGTKLCDFPTGTIKTSIDFKTYRTTCDRLICEECSTNIADDTEFCPRCMKKYQEKFVNWQKDLKLKKKL